MSDYDDLIKEIMDIGSELMEAREWGDTTWRDLNVWLDAWVIGEVEELGVHRPPWHGDNDG